MMPEMARRKCAPIRCVLTAAKPPLSASRQMISTSVIACRQNSSSPKCTPRSLESLTSMAMVASAAAASRRTPSARKGRGRAIDPSMSALYGRRGKAQALAQVEALRERGPVTICGFAMKYLHQLIFDSEADLVALAGAGLVVLSFIAFDADRLRRKRKELARVGWVPWKTGRAAV